MKMPAGRSSIERTRPHHRVATIALGVVPLAAWYAVFPIISLILVAGTFQCTAQGQALLAALSLKLTSPTAGRYTLLQTMFFALGIAAAFFSIHYSCRLAMRTFVRAIKDTRSRSLRLLVARQLPFALTFAMGLTIGSALLAANGIPIHFSSTWILGFLATIVTSQIIVQASRDSIVLEKWLISALSIILFLYAWDPEALRPSTADFHLSFGWIDFLVGMLLASSFACVMWWLAHRKGRSVHAITLYRAFAILALLLILNIQALYAYVLWFIVYRLKRTSYGASTTDLISRRAYMAVGLSVTLVAVFSAFFNFWPQAFGQLLGAPAIVIVFASIFSCAGTACFVWLPGRHKLPPSTFLVVIVAILFSPLNDNHALRSLPSKNVLYRPAPLSEDFITWYDKASQGDKDFPVFLVAAAGGGIRAAYWTAMVLSVLEDNTCNEFHKHVYVISGVSGGSLGAAVFDASLLKERSSSYWQHCLSQPWAERTSRRTRDLQRFLSSDYLSPMLGMLLFSDFPQEFFPYPAFRDRAFGLEMSWETRWSQIEGSQELGQSVAAVFSELALAGMPRLVLNSTRVGDGRRVVLSSVRIEPNDGYDLFSLLPKYLSMPFSTAIHAGARFTFVSPAGLVLDYASDGRARGSWGRLVDGGYFENSGAASLSDVVRDIAGKWQRLGRSGHPRIVAVLISNDPNDSETLCTQIDGTFRDEHRFNGTTPVRMWLPELLSPIDTLLGTRQARGSFHERELIQRIAAAFHQPVCKSVIELRYGAIEQKHATTWPIVRVAHSRSHVFESGEPPLGWFLDDRADAMLKDALKRVPEMVPFRYARDCYHVVQNIPWIEIGAFDRCSGSYALGRLVSTRWLGLLGSRNTVTVKKAIRALKKGGCAIVMIVPGEATFGDFTSEQYAVPYSPKSIRENDGRLIRAIPKLDYIYAPPGISIDVADARQKPILEVLPEPGVLNLVMRDGSKFARRAVSIAMLQSLGRPGNTLIITHRRTGALVDSTLAYLRDGEVAVFDRGPSGSMRFLATIKASQWRQ